MKGSRKASILGFFVLQSVVTAASALPRTGSAQCPDQLQEETAVTAFALLQTSQVTIRKTSSEAVMTEAVLEQMKPEEQNRLDGKLRFRLHQMLFRGDMQISLLCYFLLVWGASWWLCKNALMPIVPQSISDEFSLQKEGEQQERQDVWWGPYFCHSVSLVTSFAVVALFYQGLQGRLYFVHIPKNAGTSVEYSGLAAGISWGNEDMSFSYTLFRTQMPDENICSTYHVPPHIQQGGSVTWGRWLGPYHHAETFCITRNPADRVLSEYKYLLSDQAFWSDEYAKSYDNGLLEYRPCSVQGLNHFAQTTLRMVMEGHKYIDDCHHVPQVDYIWDPAGNQQCNNILRLDELDGQFSQLMQARGYQVQLMDEQSNENDACDHLAVSDFKKESRKLIEQVYAEDFAKLGYSPPWA